MTTNARATAGRSATLERYELLFKIGTGGAATVYLGRRRGPEGFSRLVAVKRAHPHLQGDPSEQRARLREASVASRLHHANVVAIQDVELNEQELLLVMDYVEGASLSDLLEATAASPDPAPLPIVMRIALDACAGLRAVHELTDDHGRPLSAIHRDISPQNILVGTDGLARISDFGLAKLSEAASQTTGTWRTGSMAGKLAYLAPELVQAEAYDARCDLFALGVVLWEAVASRRLFGRSSDPTTAERIVKDEAPDLSRLDARVPAELAQLVARALEKRPDDRWESARHLAEALEDVARHSVAPASRDELGRWVERTAAEALTARRELIRECSEDSADRPSLDLAFAGTASMVTGGLLPMADDAPTPHRAERALSGAVSSAHVTEGSVTARVPVTVAASDPAGDLPADEPADELTASERETISPEPASLVPSAAPRAASSRPPREPARWRLVAALAAGGLALAAGVAWVVSSSSVASDPPPPRVGSPREGERAAEAPASVPSHVARPTGAAAVESAAPSERGLSLGDEASAEAVEPDPVALDADAAQPRDVGEPDEAALTIDLDEPESASPTPQPRATKPDAPRATAPKPPANPYRR